MNHRLVVFVFINLFFINAKAWYEWYVPVFENSKLIVENKTDSNQDIWLTSPLTSEKSITLGAYEKKELVAEDFEARKSAWFKIKSFEKNLRIYSFDPVTLSSFDFDRFVSSNLKFEFQRNVSAHLFNPNYKDITLEILCYNKFGAKKISTSYKIPSQTNLDINFDSLIQNPSEIKSCEIKSDYQLAVHFSQSKNKYTNYSYQKTNNKNPKESGSVYFNVSDDSGYDFIIKLTDKDLIANARNQIKNKNAAMPRLLVAKVDYGHGGFNFNLSDLYRNNWSWHVSQVYGFKDFGSTSCNGFPQYLQENLKSWIDYNNGLICFWTFQVNKELTN